MPRAVQQILQDAQMARMGKSRKKWETAKERRDRKIMDPKYWGKHMDPEVWGNLPPNLTLAIYKKLPLQSFYRLREVCKDWNSLARERRCATNPIHKPYFVLIRQGEDGVDVGLDDEEIRDMVEAIADYYLHGMLTFHIASGRWRWTKLHAIPVRYKLLSQPFSVKGLALSCDRPDHYQIFDAHTKKRYIISQQPKPSEMSRSLDMAVDTSVVPHTFKIIVGSLDVGTQIYNSVTESWETRPSRLIPCEEPKFKTCLQYNDHLYIWSQSDKILVYSLEEDKWSTLNPPPRHERDSFLQVVRIRECLGSWQGELFAVRTDNRGRTMAPLLWVWKFGEQKTWEFVDEMPDNMQKWLLPVRLHVYDDVQVFSSFCDELLLIYSWVPETCRAYRFVLYNPATKKWEKVEAPNRSVSTNVDKEKDTVKWDVVDSFSRQRQPGFMGAPMMSHSELMARGLHDYLTGNMSWIYDN